MNARTITHSARRFLSHILILAACVWLAPGVKAQSPAPVGTIEGQDARVRMPGDPAPAAAASGTLLLSGSEVTVGPSQARIRLLDGGVVDICGPAQLALLKSGRTLTVAVSSGRVRVHIEGPIGFSVYTPMVVATPVAIATGPRELTLGLDAGGAMCIHSTEGAVRLEQQFSGESIILPQAGEATLAGNQLRLSESGSDACRCDVMMAAAPPQPVAGPPSQPMVAETKTAPLPSTLPITPVQTANLSTETRVRTAPTAAAPPAAPPVVLPTAVVQPPVRRSAVAPEIPKPAAGQPSAPLIPAAELPVEAELAVPVRPGDVRPTQASRHASAPSEPRIEEPAWMVQMPPLAFNANQPPPPEPSAEMIVLVRRVRVEPEWVFGGTVGEYSAPSAHAQERAESKESVNPSKPKSESKFRNFFARLFGSGTCKGVGCPK